MAGSKSDFFEVAVLKIATGVASGITGISGTATPYLALFTGTYTGDTPGTEATGGGYARVNTSGLWGTPTSGAGTVANTSAITVGPFSGSVSAGAAFTHFGLFDASTAGNAFYYGDLSNITFTGGNGDSIQFAIGALVLTEG